MLRDKGAHFHKCDLQIHTPRDLNWKGEFSQVTTDAERRQYAAALVAACRRKCVNAIGITDHHDICLWRYVRDAASSEKQPDGRSIEVDQQITVFPGMELTFSDPPCQALVLFDPQLPFSDAFVNTLKGALSIAPSPDTEAKSGPLEKLSTRLRFEDIVHVLSELVANPEATDPSQRYKLQGRFIILVHVRKAGHKTVTRMGFNAIYANMPFVGGYIEQHLYKDLEDGNVSIVEGRDENWGCKSLGIFQTSDARGAESISTAEGRIVDFPDLGGWPTWVKWAVPSAEALRQACLARTSRIAHTEPVLPSHQILSVEISNSKFLGAAVLSLNPQFNSFIGGRGTGKSTLLEYIRWALCDDPQAFDEDVASAEELPNFQKRRRSLIDSTLKPFNAKVVVCYRKNNVDYRLERSTAERAEVVQVTGPDGSVQTMAGEQVRREFPIVSYAQKQLSSVGTLPDEVKRIITDPIKAKLGELNEKILQNILPRLKEQRLRERRVSELDAKLADLQLSIKTKREQVRSLQSDLGAVTPEQRDVIQAHEALTQQDQWIKTVQERPGQLQRFLTEAKTKIGGLADAVVRDDSPMKADLQRVAEAANRLKKDINDALQALIDRTATASALGDDASRVIQEAAAAYAEHSALYDAYIKDAARNKQQMESIQTLNNQITRDEAAVAAAGNEKNGLLASGDPGPSPWDEWINAHADRARLQDAQCQRINALAQYSFKAKLLPCGDKRGLVDGLQKVVERCNVRDADAKILRMAETITGCSDPLQKWAEVIKELDELLKAKGASVAPAAPLFTAAGFSPANLQAIQSRADLPDLVETIRYVPIDDHIEFQYAFGRSAAGADNYIPFQQASPGQQATCLLKTLFAESGTPLLIDQPEEDLDNEQIQALAERICETKHNRQMIFVSHNANIVVNGDTELVVCFSYHDPSDRTKGRVDRVGSIDCAHIRDAITSVMEGGKEAFELRRMKYGF